MEKINQSAFIAIMALVCYASFATAKEVSFDKPGDTTNLVNELKLGGPGGPGGHGGGQFNPNPPAPVHPGGPGHHDGPGPQPGPWHPQPGPQPGPWHPQPPMPPQPGPWHPQPPMPPQPYPPQPSHNGDLYGYCQDFDHSQFAAAKNFAYGGSGLNYNDSDATNWALSYNQSHACGTIQEYSARYTELYNYSYSGSYMNLNASDARGYALRYVEVMNVPQVRVWKEMYTAVYQFFYSGSYLNDNASDSVAGARAWNERGYCGDAQTVQNMKAEYTRQYTFAYSGSGLNYNTQNAKNYALGSVRNMTPCGDLLK